MINAQIVAANLTDDDDDDEKEIFDFSKTRMAKKIPARNVSFQSKVIARWIAT